MVELCRRREHLGRPSSAPPTRPLGGLPPVRPIDIALLLHLPGLAGRVPTGDNWRTIRRRGEAQGEPMTLARIFVTAAYVCLGLSFLASTGLLVREFQDADWQAMALAHSHLFFFFPVF